MAKANIKLNKTPGGSFTRDPKTGKLTQTAKTERTPTQTKPAAEPTTQVKEK